MTLIFNPAKDDLEKVFRDYQEETMKVLWERGDRGATTKDAWIAVNDRLIGKTISRASIILFLNKMVDEGILDYVERTGKGGIHKLYKPKFNQSSFIKHIVRRIFSSLMKDYPKETLEIIKSYK